MKKNLTAFTRLTRLARLTCITILSLAATLSHAQVGMRKMVSGDMPITVVYPTAAAVQPINNGPFTIQAAKDAAPLPAPPGSRRLIGSTDNDHDLAATLARAGFVVAQPLHRGDNFKDHSRSGPASWLTRPGEVTETINALAQDPVLGRQIDLLRVGVHGMSAGGGTGIMMAGGQWRMLAMVQHCALNLQEDIGFCLNGLGQRPDLQAQRQREFEAARGAPEAAMPENLKVLLGGRGVEAQDIRPDPRITAVSVAVPLGVIFTPESLARIRIPVALITAGNDGVLLPRFHSEKILQYCASCTRLSDHPIAGHFDWLSPWPAPVATAVAATQTRGGMPNSSFSPEERQKAFDQIAVFFQQKL
jgi:predicted dienelactone hydrolase